MFDIGDDMAESPARRSKIADLVDWPDGKVPSMAIEEPAPARAMEPDGDPLVVARREFAVLLGEFRRTAVLVPLDGSGDLWSAEQGGVRWICAFSDEVA
ncbi:SseB family protein, partial [Streptomyces sp. NPDC001948]